MSKISTIVVDGNSYDVCDNKGRNIITDDYVTNKQYQKGDFVIYQKLLYKCLGNTSGSFDGSKWEETKVVENLGGGGDSGNSWVPDSEDLGPFVDRSLEEINFNIDEIGSYAFAGCSSLTTISFSKCTSLSYCAFHACSSLTTVSFPKCATIDNNAFERCSSLTTASFPECTTIGNFAFYACYSLTTISFPKCTNIGYSAFYACSSLTTISFPKCTSISYGAFGLCDSLTTISFPECITIDNGAFKFCYSLTTISFPECTTIGSSAFQNCSSLTTASFPKCTTISNYAFSSCTLLSQIYLANSQVCTLANSNAFLGTKITATRGSIYVPASLVNTYKAKTNWTYFKNRIFSRG